ncbi:uncharacterized protein [Ptychodera flava]|uniref:uncharacterized protein n=1 Tax=Ptychodera flava TaxID=63121 RepID=UPI00396AA8F8
MGEWSNGLCGCFGNFGICAITYFVPCVTAGRNAEAVGENCVKYAILSMCGPCGIYFQAKIREKIREQKGIEGTFMNDCLMHWFCTLCALVQEAREVTEDSPGGQAMARY